MEQCYWAEHSYYRDITETGSAGVDSVQWTQNRDLVITPMTLRVPSKAVSFLTS